MRGTIERFFEKEMIEAKLLVPYAKSHMLGEIRRLFRVITESYSEDGVMVSVRGAPQELARLAEQASH